MDALAEKWYHSGKKAENLYNGRKEEILKALRSWIKARSAQNEATIRLLWDFFGTNDAIFALRKELGSPQDIHLAPFKAKFVKNIERIEEYKKERDKLNRRALFLLSTMTHRGFKWSEIPCRSQWSEMDAEVCACLKSQEATFNAESQLSLLEMEDEIAAWHREHTRREAEEEVPGGQAPSPNTNLAAAVILGAPGGVQEDSAHDEFLDPVDGYGLIQSPATLAADTPLSSPSSLSFGATGGVPLETEDTAEAVALRIENASIADEKPKAEGKSKTQKRNAARRKAKARAKEAAGEKNAAGGDEGGLE